MIVAEVPQRDSGGTPLNDITFDQAAAVVAAVHYETKQTSTAVNIAVVDAGGDVHGVRAHGQCLARQQGDVVIGAIGSSVGNGRQIARAGAAAVS